MSRAVPHVDHLAHDVLGRAGKGLHAVEDIIEGVRFAAVLEALAAAREFGEIAAFEREDTMSGGGSWLGGRLRASAISGRPLPYAGRCRFVNSWRLVRSDAASLMLSV